MLDWLCYSQDMEKKKKRLTDINLIASHIVAEVTTKLKPEKNPAAVALGSLGGLKGGKARSEKLSAERRKEIAQKAAKARWKRS